MYIRSTHMYSFMYILYLYIYIHAYAARKLRADVAGSTKRREREQQRESGVQAHRSVPYLLRFALNHQGLSVRHSLLELAATARKWRVRSTAMFAGLRAVVRKLRDQVYCTVDRKIRLDVRIDRPLLVHVRRPRRAPHKRNHERACQDTEGRTPHRNACPRGAAIQVVCHRT